MFKIIISLLFLLPLAAGNPSSKEAATCNCTEVANIQKTVQTSNSLAYAWDASASATEYKVWYTREEDNYTSAYFYTSGTSYNFTNLSAGQYTFYFVAVCGEGSSGWVGIEDVVQY